MRSHGGVWKHTQVTIQCPFQISGEIYIQGTHKKKRKSRKISYNFSYLFWFFYYYLLKFFRENFTLSHISLILICIFLYSLQKFYFLPLHRLQQHYHEIDNVQIKFIFQEHQWKKKNKKFLSQKDIKFLN